MTRIRKNLGAAALLGAFALTGWGCARGPSPEVQHQLDQLATVSAEKDSLLQQVAENARLMSDITNQITKVRGIEKVKVPVSESPMRAPHDTLLARIAAVVTRVDRAEQHLAASRRRVAGLTNLSDSLKAQLTQSIDQFQSVIDNQKATIASLTEQVNQLQTQNAALTERNASLTDTVSSMTTRENTVYYVIGTKNELKQKGIVVEEGGSRFPLIFKKVGTTLKPARDLNPSDFTAIDRTKVTQIALPDSTQEYRVASGQNLDYLASPPQDGKVHGTLQIASPAQFWAASKFLILVRG